MDFISQIPYKLHYLELKWQEMYFMDVTSIAVPWKPYGPGPVAWKDACLKPNACPKDGKPPLYSKIVMQLNEFYRISKVPKTGY